VDTGSARKHKFTLSHIKQNIEQCTRTFNSIYYRSKGASSEFVSVQLFKSYCLPFILYVTEAIPLTKSSVRLLDNCVKQAVAKFFKVYNTDSIDVLLDSSVMCQILVHSLKETLKFCK